MNCWEEHNSLGVSFFYQNMTRFMVGFEENAMYNVYILSTVFFKWISFSQRLNVIGFYSKKY